MQQYMYADEIQRMLGNEWQVAGAGNNSGLLLAMAAQALDRASRRVGGLAGAQGGSEVILVVEDEDTIRALVRTILEMKGYAVCEARNGREGLAVCGTHEGRIDLLVSDIEMPEVGGRELAEGALRLRPEMRVMFMSGYTGNAGFQQAVCDGTPFLQKPFTPVALALKVREALDGSALAAGQG